jgi:hypothetical protein
MRPGGRRDVMRVTEPESHCAPERLTSRHRPAIASAGLRCFPPRNHIRCDDPHSAARHVDQRCSLLRSGNQSPRRHRLRTRGAFRQVGGSHQ